MEFVHGLDFAHIHPHEMNETHKTTNFVRKKLINFQIITCKPIKAVVKYNYLALETSLAVSEEGQYRNF